MIRSYNTGIGKIADFGLIMNKVGSGQHTPAYVLREYPLAMLLDVFLVDRDPVTAGRRQDAAKKLNVQWS